MSWFDSELVLESVDRKGDHSGFIALNCDLNYKWKNLCPAVFRSSRQPFIQWTSNLPGASLRNRESAAATLKVFGRAVLEISSVYFKRHFAVTMVALFSRELRNNPFVLQLDGQCTSEILMAVRIIIVPLQLNKISRQNCDSSCYLKKLQSSARVRIMKVFCSMSLPDITTG